MLVKTRKQKVTQSKDVAAIIQAILAAQDKADQDKEQFYVIGLNASSRILYVDLVHIGSLESCQVHPRESFRLAVQHAAAAIIMAHNHPSCEVVPSDCDNKTTERMAEAGKILGIQVLDHVIVGSDDYFSYAECGILT